MTTFLAPDHVLTMLATALACVTLPLLVRRHRGHAVDVACSALGVLLIANELVYVATEVPTWSWATSMPLYLCDVAGVVAGLALVFRRPLLAEVTWFWALAGTLQGILTPDQYHAFPSYMFWQYYIDHCGVVLAACVLVGGLGMVPRRGAVRHVLALTAAFTAAVGLADVVTGGNYMYLRHTPAAGSALDLLGPWPWYIVSATGVAVVAVAALDLPFRGGRHASRGHLARASARRA